jgi:glyoxylase-like metal-dependent hydrolase (beta-lactamase superfamily II)
MAAGTDDATDAMAGAILHAATPLGGLTRVVLGHGHVDHRGAAPRLGVPVLCHPDERPRASMRKPAALEPATVWSGHADPVTGDVGRELERAAATT